MSSTCSMMLVIYNFINWLHSLIFCIYVPNVYYIEFVLCCTFIPCKKQTGQQAVLHLRLLCCKIAIKTEVWRACCIFCSSWYIAYKLYTNNFAKHFFVLKNFVESMLKNIISFTVTHLATTPSLANFLKKCSSEISVLRFLLAFMLVFLL